MLQISGNLLVEGFAEDKPAVIGVDTDTTVSIGRLDVVSSLQPHLCTKMLAKYTDYN